MDNIFNLIQNTIFLISLGNGYDLAQKEEKKSLPHLPAEILHRQNGSCQEPWPFFDSIVKA